MEVTRLTFSVCCNPFKEVGHSMYRKNLRNVLPWMTIVFPHLTDQHKVCDKCRKTMKLQSSKIDEVQDDCLIVKEDLEGKNEDYLARDTAVQSLNDSLLSVGESPVKVKRLGETKYPIAKLAKIDYVLKEKIFQIPSDKETPSANPDPEILKQLKEKYLETTKKSEKVTILTLLPKSWSIRKVQSEFPVSNYMIRKAKTLVKEQGILSSPNPKPGRTLPPLVADAVKEVYCSDEVSRVMPGKKDFVTVKVSGTRTHEQKRLVLSNLKEVYAHFKSSHPEMKVGFSKFATLRPKNCILAGASGTHSVCVCTAHQNVKLMLEGLKLSELTKDSETHLFSYHHCLAIMICNPANQSCFFSGCNECPGPPKLKEFLENILEANAIETVTYKQWLTTDRSNLETIIKSGEDFLDTLLDKLSALLRHSFIASQQSKFLNELKANIEPGECVVLCDFAENYSFILQDEAQGYHWNNAQATIHPFAIYFKDSISTAVTHENLTVISDCLKHDTTAVHLFQRHLVTFLKDNINQPLKKIIYFSDGSAAQYKNRKNFLNLTLHQEDFGVPAEWHFFATSHGKSACDGLGGTLKRLAARASLQRPYSDQIMTPRQLFDWSQSNLAKMNVILVTEEQYKEEEKLLIERFSCANPIRGTQKLHTFLPVKNGVLLAKIFSASSESTEYSVSDLEDSNMQLKDITGFVTCVYDSSWWLGCVLSVDENTNEVKISFLHPHGPSPSFVYPSCPDILNIPRTAVLTKVDTRTATGRTYTLTDVETKSACNNLGQINH